MIRADELLDDACRKLGIDLAILVAETALWANPEVHRRLMGLPDGPAWYPDRRRYRKGQGEQKGQRINGVYLDDNTYANYGLKQALGYRNQELDGFEVCHVWRETTYDARYHTCIANLVLLPRPVAGLSDHDSRVRASLQFRAFELYGWHPDNVPSPKRPDRYPTNWREPAAMPSRCRRLRG